MRARARVVVAVMAAAALTGCRSGTDRLPQLPTVAGAATAACPKDAAGPVLLAITVAAADRRYSLERVTLCVSGPVVQPDVTQDVSAVAAYRDTIVVTYSGRVRDQVYYLRGTQGVPLPKGGFDSAFSPVFTPDGTLVMPVLHAKRDVFDLVALPLGAKTYQTLYTLPPHEVMFGPIVDGGGRVVVPLGTSSGNEPTSRLAIVDGEKVRTVDVAAPQVRAGTWLSGDRLLLRGFSGGALPKQYLYDLASGSIQPLELDDTVVARINDESVLAVSPSGVLSLLSGDGLATKRELGRPPGDRVVAGTWLPPVE
jgi:hypothetical protein